MTESRLRNFEQWAAATRSRDTWIAKILEVNASERLRDPPDAAQLLGTSFGKGLRNDGRPERPLWARVVAAIGLAASVLWIWRYVVRRIC